MTERHELAIVGLGKMGSSLARQGIDKGLRVIGLTRRVVDAELQAAGVLEAKRDDNRSREVIAVEERGMVDIADVFPAARECVNQWR